MLLPAAPSPGRGSPLKGRLCSLGPSRASSLPTQSLERADVGLALGRLSGGPASGVCGRLSWCPQLLLLCHFIFDFWGRLSLFSLSVVNYMRQLLGSKVRLPNRVV